MGLAWLEYWGPHINNIWECLVIFVFLLVDQDTPDDEGSHLFVFILAFHDLPHSYDLIRYRERGARREKIRGWWVAGWLVGRSNCMNNLHRNFYLLLELSLIPSSFPFPMKNHHFIVR